MIVSDNASAATATTHELIRRVGLDVAKNFPGGPEEFAKLSDDDKSRKFNENPESANGPHRTPQGSAPA